jgi:predicted unusual protein kinase regulating ubiquinone biosynthesis (AarF/ABC1/UbiB family)
MGRALEVLGITWNEWLSPLGWGLLPPDNQNPSSWEEFWELSLKNTATTTPKDVLVAEQFTRYLERLGATYVKFGQALSSRPDIVPRSLAVALSKLQDDMEVTDDSLRLATAEGARAVLRKEYNVEPQAFRDSDEMEGFLATLSEEPVAAASIGVVYSGILPGTNGTDHPGQKVAIKIQRPNVKETVEKDARLLRRAAELIEAIPSLPDGGGEASSSSDDATTTTNNNSQDATTNRWIQTNLTGAVDEFMTRLEEELDYRREANNLELFGKLYSHQRTPDSESGTAELVNLPSGKDINVVVPRVYRHLCTDKVLVMEWIDGIKLVELQATPTTNDETEVQAKKDEIEETLELIRQGIDCTLSQLLETGILHADPHGGNLLKVADDATEDAASSAYRLGYIDFGMLSTIPSTVQDGLICAVCQLIFANNVTAVSELFGELQLLPEDILEDPVESAALAEELTLAIGKVLVFPTDEENAFAEAEGRPKIPSLRFDKLLDVLTRLVPRFRFQLPPYFLNNARALATLEGMAREVDPNFNILRNLYPYAINRIFSNPTDSPVVEMTLRSLIQTPSTGRIDPNKLRKLLKDASNFSGYSKLKVIGDIAKSKSGPGLVGRLAKEQTVGRILRKRRKRKASSNNKGIPSRRGRKRRWLLDKLAAYSRL